MVSISDIDCTAKIWEYKAPLLLCILDPGIIYKNGMMKWACFIPYDSTIFLSVKIMKNIIRGII